MFCQKCGVKNTAGANFCANCGSSMNSLPPQTAVPVYYVPAPARVKKRKWPWIFAGIILIIAVVLFFSNDDYETPDYGNSFAPSQAQQNNNTQGLPGGNSSQFSAALDAIREGDGFASHSGSSTSASAGNNKYDNLYSEIYEWTDDDWEIFWEIMYEYLDDDEMAYILNLDEDELLELIIEILSEE